MDLIDLESSRFGLVNSRQDQRNHTILAIGSTGKTESAIAGACSRNAPTARDDVTDIGLDYAQAAQTR